MPDSTPTPNDHVAAVGAALPLVALAERGDPDAFALALSEAVSDPHDAGAVVYGLVALIRMTLSLPALHGPERLEALDGMLLDLAEYR